MGKRLITLILISTPIALFAADPNVETDIVERTVNFLIFAAIIYYLLADKLKSYFKNRTEEIKGELNKVQDLVKESEKKVQNAKEELEEAKKIAKELVTSAKNDTSTIKAKIENQIEHDLAYLERSFDEKTELQVRKLKKEVVREILEELMSNENMSLSQDELTNIVLKKVA